MKSGRGKKTWKMMARNFLAKKEIEHFSTTTTTTTMPPPSDIAIHHSVRPYAALFLTRQPPRCRITPPHSTKSRRKRDALATYALPNAADAFVFSDAALATQSAAVASFPPAASFETAVYAVSCYLDSMVQQSLAGTKKIREGEREKEERKLK